MRAFLKEFIIGLSAILLLITFSSNSSTAYASCPNPVTTGGGITVNAYSLTFTKQANVRSFNIKWCMNTNGKGSDFTDPLCCGKPSGCSWNQTNWDADKSPLTDPNQDAVDIENYVAIASPQTIDALFSRTPYKSQVQAVCADGSTSAWVSISSAGYTTVNPLSANFSYTAPLDSVTFTNPNNANNTCTVKISPYGQDAENPQTGKYGYYYAYPGTNYRKWEFADFKTGTATMNYGARYWWNNSTALDPSGFDVHSKIYRRQAGDNAYIGFSFNPGTCNVQKWNGSKWQAVAGTNVEYFQQPVNQNNIDSNNIVDAHYRLIWTPPPPLPNCNQGISCATPGTCTLKSGYGNTCSGQNGSQTNTNCTYTTYSGSGDCTPAAASNQTVDCGPLIACDTGYKCSSGSCVPVNSCTQNSDCNDVNPCTTDTCSSSKCSNPPVADGTIWDADTGYVCCGGTKINNTSCPSDVIHCGTAGDGGVGTCRSYFPAFPNTKNICQLANNCFPFETPYSQNSKTDCYQNRSQGEVATCCLLPTSNPGSCTVNAVVYPTSGQLIAGGAQGSITGSTTITGMSVKLQGMNAIPGANGVVTISPTRAITNPPFFWTVSPVSSGSNIVNSGAMTCAVNTGGNFIECNRDIATFTVVAPTPIPCQSTTSPSSQTIPVGNTGIITANVTSGLAGATISSINFKSSDANIVSVPGGKNDYTTTSSPYTALITANETGNASIQATVALSDGRACPSAAATDTDITVSNPTYSINGNIYLDSNGNEKKSSGETYFTGISNITLNNNPSITPDPASGNYSFSNLPAGTYTVTFSGLPNGSIFTFPPNNGCGVNGGCVGVIVGAGCFVPTDPAPSDTATWTSCDARNNIINLNAGVTNDADPWFQSIGSDIRWDSGFSTLKLPSGKYASIAPTNGMPGIMFSGASSFPFPDQASEKVNGLFNWQVGSFSNPDFFTTSHSSIYTSYNFLLETALKSGFNPGTTINYSTPGIYKVNGLTIDSPIAFGRGNFVILINGDLLIKAKITVPVGSTAIFSASGNITVDRTVGEAAGSTVSTIEGLYSADNSFIADGKNNCASGKDLRLNVAGSVIANAGRLKPTPGTFTNNRTLCGSNASNPSVTFTERPDFMLNYPTLVQQLFKSSQDIAP